MCTLVFALGVYGPGSVLLATNRDEDPARASQPPQVLHRSPRILGGRDAVAGGTWLALRAGEPRAAAAPPGQSRAPAVALLLNRHDPDPARPGRRSRGLLTLDVAASSDPRATALAEAATGRYAPCSLVWLAGESAWLLAIRAGESPTLEPIAPGWHAITHFELDDTTDARAAWLLAQLAQGPPASRIEAEPRLAKLLATHGDAVTPAVCLHSGRAVTVSAALLWLSGHAWSYRHAQGPPCTTPFADQARLAGLASGSVE